MEQDREAASAGDRRAGRTICYDAGNNAVAHDAAIGPPRHLQWACGPAWSRHHDHMASLSAMVSAQGRVFYIMDEGPREAILLPSQWSLIARDAFNGTVLWKRPIAEWNTQLWPLKSGPNQLPRRLVAVGDRVYVTLGIDAPVTVLDAATGKTSAPAGTRAHRRGARLRGHAVPAGRARIEQVEDYRPKFSFVWDNTERANRDWAWDGQPRSVMAVTAAAGARALEARTPRGAPHAGRRRRAACSSSTVKRSWPWIARRAERRGPRRRCWRQRARFPTGYGPTLVLHNDVVLLSVEQIDDCFLPRRRQETLDRGASPGRAPCRPTTCWWSTAWFGPATSPTGSPRASLPAATSTPGR